MKKMIDTVLRGLNRVPRLNVKLARVCERYIGIAENFDYNHESNGEKWLVRALARAGLLSVCFDVGANKGDWSLLVLEENSTATIHAFEVSPKTYAKLTHRLGSDSRVRINAFGLADKSGTILLKHCLDSDGLTSMVEVVCSQNIENIEAQVIRGVDYCVERDITKIDFLKIDVEGAENLVLEGFAHLLKPDAIPVIQIEYGMVNIASKFLLRDFYKLFLDRGYVVGKLFPDHVRFRDYRFEDEDFLGPNYIAAAPEIAKLIEKPTR